MKAIHKRKSTHKKILTHKCCQNHLRLLQSGDLDNSQIQYKRLMILQTQTFLVFSVKFDIFINYASKSIYTF